VNSEAGRNLSDEGDMGSFEDLKDCQEGSEMKNSQLPRGQ
jgi:hypothetical protein